MATVTPSLVKTLREQTGAGMMDCKKALEENGGDLEAATDWLRKKGLAAAAKKAGRTTADGLVAVKVAGLEGAAVEVNAETDFVARNEQFQAMVRAIAEVAPSARGDVETLKKAKLPSGRTVEDEVAQLIGVIGENMALRRTGYVQVDEGVIASYVHGAVSAGLGKIGVLVGLRSKADPAKLQEVGRQIAMHVAAANPLALQVADLDPNVVARERAIYAEQARASGKAENIIEKMVEGRMRKFHEETVLAEQAFVVDTDKRIKDVLAEAGKRLGSPVEVTAFVRMQVGEGIDKQADDLAAEVAKLTGR